jgi:predicted DNA binding CopG/RHH family protein
MVTKLPKLVSDKEAGRILDQDLSGLDFSQFKPVQFEFAAKNERATMRLPKALPNAVRERAVQAGIPYRR